MKINGKRVRWGISQKVFSIFVALVLIPSFLVGFFTYKSSSSNLSRELESSAKDSISSVNALVEAVVTPVMRDVSVMADTIESSDYAITPKNPETNLSTSPQVTKVLQTFKISHLDDTEVIGLAKQDGAFAMEPVSPLKPDYDARTRQWYKAAMETKGKVIISDPYISAASKNTVVSIAKTTKAGDAVAVVNLSLKKYLTDTVSKQKIGEAGFVFVVDQTKKVLAHPTLAGGTDMSTSEIKDSFSGMSGTLRTTFDGKDATVYYITNGLTGWKIYGVLYDSELNAVTNEIMLTSASMVLLSIVVSALIVFWFSRTFLQPIKKMTDMAVRLSEGDLTVEDLNVKSKDELGDLSNAFASLTGKLRTIIGNLSSSVQEMNKTTQTLNSSSDNVYSSAQEIASASTRVSSAASTQKESTSEIARALLENSAGVSSIAESASEIGNISEDTHHKATSGANMASQTVTQMQTIKSAVEESSTNVDTLANKSVEIGQFAKLISDIASQTNLLALNASIEAARAGAHGSGFAVVAQEVKKLSIQSSDAAKEISQMINDIAASVDEVVGSLTLVLSEVKTGVEMSANVQELFVGISKDMSQLNDEIQNLSSVSQQMAASSEEISASVEELSKISASTSSDADLVSQATNKQHEVIDTLTTIVESVSQTASTLESDIMQFKTKVS